MKSFVMLALSAALVCGQPPQPPKIAPGTPAPIVPAPQAAPAAPATPAPVAPDSVVLEAGGKKYTAAEVDKLIEALPAQFRQAAKTQPQAFTTVFLTKRLVEDAEKAGLDKKSPYKEQLEYNRMQLLAQAYLNDYSNHVNVTSEDQDQYYKANPDKFKQAKVRVIQQAKQIVMDTRGVSEEQAYQMLRAQAMLKREQIETVAGEIVKARETLSF